MFVRAIRSAVYVAMALSCNDGFSVRPMPPPGTASPAPSTPSEITIEGQRYSVMPGTRDSISRLRDHASKIIPCAPEQLRVRELVFGLGAPAWQAVVADGCGQRIVYGEAGHVRIGGEPDQPTGTEYLIVSRVALEPPAPR
jgi:hypothetical protein